MMLHSEILRIGLAIARKVVASTTNPIDDVLIDATIDAVDEIAKEGVHTVVDPALKLYVYIDGDGVVTLAGAMNPGGLDCVGMLTLEPISE